MRVQKILFRNREQIDRSNRSETTIANIIKSIIRRNDDVDG